MLENITSSNLLIWLVSLILAMTLHEAMHAYASHWLGDDTAQREGRISLNPLRHIDPLTTILLPIVTLALFHFPFIAAKPVPFNPNRVKYGEYGAALVGIAGPFTNLFLALLAAGFVHLFNGSASLSVLNAAVIFGEINIILFVFNMIPIPPLDGSRLLYAFAPESVQEFMARLERIGIFIILALVLLVPAFDDVLIHLYQSLFNILF